MNLPQLDRRIPVTLLTGFLGAGKTTLLNHLLRMDEMAGAAVLINEFGEVGIDNLLVEKVDESMMILDSGCICCSVQGDLVKALRNLAERSSRREIPEVTRVVIETTGLADPVPVVLTLTQERFVASRYQCSGVVTAVDATHALGQLDRHPEAVRQVAMADRLLITKCDLAGGDQLDLLAGRLAQLNPGASRIEVRNGLVSAGALCGCGIYTTVGKNPDVAGWLGTHSHHGHHGHHAHHASEGEGERVASFIVQFPEPVSWYAFSVAMGTTLERYAAGILRIKGLMNIAGDVLPRVVHCVQQVAYPPVSLEQWPKEAPFCDEKGRLVFIVRGLSQADVAEIRKLLSGARNRAGNRGSLALCPIPTRCWLSHQVSRSAPSEIDVEGWTVQGIRLGRKSA